MDEKGRNDFGITWKWDDMLRSWYWNGNMVIVQIFQPTDHSPVWRAFKDEGGAWKGMRRFEGSDAETLAFQYAARLVRQKQAMERLYTLNELSDPDDEYLIALDKLIAELKQAMGKGLGATVKLLPSVETVTNTEEQKEVEDNLEESFREESVLMLVPKKEFDDADGHHTVWTVENE